MSGPRFSRRDFDRLEARDHERGGLTVECPNCDRSVYVSQAVLDAARAATPPMEPRMPTVADIRAANPTMPVPPLRHDTLTNVPPPPDRPLTDSERRAAWQRLREANSALRAALFGTKGGPALDDVFAPHREDEA